MVRQEPILHFNRKTQCYEGLLLVQVDAELFRRLLIRSIEEDEQADLTDAATWTAAITKIGKITHWLDKPQAKLTPLASAPSHETTKPEPVSASMNLRQPTLYQLVESRLRERARKIPPYQWESLRTPLIPGPSESPEKQKIYYIRSDEAKVLTMLRAEWEAGTYQLEGSAARQQIEHEEQERRKVSMKLGSSR